MGKKKSVVLMTLLTIVIVVLCAITAFPAFTLPGSNGVKKWTPAVLQYDLGPDFGGGYYAYYYPQGVITETEYKKNEAALEGDELTEYKDSYKQYKDTSLYLSTDPDDGIYTVEDKENVTEGFKTAFNKAVELVSARFAERAAMKWHTVRSGDTLYKLARMYDTTVSNICKMNGINQNATLKVGKKLRVR